MFPTVLLKALFAVEGRLVGAIVVDGNTRPLENMGMKPAEDAV